MRFAIGCRIWRRAAGGLEQRKVPKKRKTSGGLPWWKRLFISCKSCSTSSGHLQMLLLGSFWHPGSISWPILAFWNLCKW